MNDYAGYLTIGAELDTKEFDSQITYIESQMLEIEEKLKKADMGFEIGEDVLKLEKQYETLGNRLVDLKKKQDDYNRSIRNASLSGINNIKEQLSKIGKSVDNVTSKVGRWAIALFGIRSAYSFIRQSISTLSQHNEKLATDLQYIRYALASALEPIITRIVNLVYTLLQYLGYIIYQWTGKNIFENANKGLKKATGQAKELQKTLQQTAFDEMNVLQDNKSGGGAGGGSPSVDLSKIQGNVPKWVEWIGKNGKKLLVLVGGLVAGILAMKTGLGAIKSLGIGIAVAGLIKLIQSIIDYLKDPSWDNFGDIIIGLALLVGGLAIAFGAWPVALAAAILLMIGIIAKFWDDIKRFLDNLIKDIYKFGDNAMKFLTDKLGIFGTLIGGFINLVTGGVAEMVRLVRDRLDSLFNGIKTILDGIIQIFKGNFKEGLLSVIKGIANLIIGVVNTVINGLNLVLTPMRAIIMVGARVLGEDWTMEDIRIPNIPKLARGGIVHNPNGGVMMGSYIAGEGADPEAVIPLNDETLDRLGERIAKHMTINANIVNNMNGRTISRELQKINNESNFAYNS